MYIMNVDDYTNTNFVDSETTAKFPYCGGGNPRVDFLQAFNNGVAYFDGTGDFLSSAQSTDFDFGSGNWTVWYWARWTTVGTTALVSKYSGAGARSSSCYYSGGGLYLYYSTCIII